MKKILFALALLAFASCVKEDVIENESIDGKEYIVNLGFSGEIEISHSPLSKAGTNDLYGVQVYSWKSGESDYAPYAYGLFDNTADMTVKLIGGYQYKFVASMVEDGKNKLHTFEGNYYPPFDAISAYCPLSNSFSYSSDIKMDGLEDGYTWMAESDGTGDNAFYRPNTIRYYGVLTDFTPAENKSATISMKRVCFGAKFVVNDFTDGKITINIPEAPAMTINYPDTEVGDIFTFMNRTYGESWIDDDYEENLQVSITWTKADGTVIPISNQIIKFARNEMTTVTINLKEDSTNTDIEMEVEDGDIQPGENVTINR